MTVYIIKFIELFFNIPGEEDFTVYTSSALLGLILAVYSFKISKNRYSKIAMIMSVISVVSIVIGIMLFPLFIFD